MLRKEVNEISRQSVYFIISVVVGTFLVLVGFALARSFPSYAELFLPVYQLGILMFSLFLGISLFASDMKDGGMEYLLTLPYSRVRLLMYKVVPRTAALLLCYVLYLPLKAVFVSGLDMQWFTPPVLFHMCIALFVIGASFSVFRGSFIIAGLATAFIFFVYMVIVRSLYTLVKLLKLESYEGLRDIIYGSALLKTHVSIYFTGFVLLAAFAGAFVYAFKRFELGSPRNFTRRYLKVFIPIVVVGLVVSWIWVYREIHAPDKYYILLASNRLIESNYYNTWIYQRKGVNKIFTRSIDWDSFVEKDGYLYVYDKSQLGVQKILRLDPENNTYNTFYQPERKNYIICYVYSYKETIAVIESGVKGGLVLIDIGTKSVKRINLVKNLREWDTYHPRFFGAGEIEGKRFWLLYYGFHDGSSIQVVWEDGQLAELGDSDMRPVYANGMLITIENKHLVFKRITLAGTEVIETKPVPVEGKFYLSKGYSTNNLDRTSTEELYGVILEEKEDIYKLRYKKVLRVDLQTLEITEVKALEDQRGGFFYCHPDTWYSVKFDFSPADDAREEPVLKALYRLKQGNLELVKEFEPMNVGDRQSQNYCDFFDTGFVLKKNGKVSVYSLPDLQPIPFEELD